MSKALTRVALALGVLAAPGAAIAYDGDIVFLFDNYCLKKTSVYYYDSAASSRASCKWGGNFCFNDAFRSVWVSSSVKAGTVIRVYDSPNGKRDDDWSEITVRSAAANDYGRRLGNGFCVSTFEQNYSGTDYKIRHRHKNGLDGKISFVEIVRAP